MSHKVYNYKSSPRSCLLLKTLLFLLCIYIKRVTAFQEDKFVFDHFGANINQQAAYIEKIAIEGDMGLEITCPLRDLVRPKEHLPKTINQTYLNHLREEIILRTRVIWKKDGQLLHRVNGNYILQIQDPGNKTHVFLIPTPSDSGAYVCIPDYTQISLPEAYKYFNLYPSITIDLEVVPLSNLLPDIEPAITNPPSNMTVERGSNVTFTCNRIDTLSHQTTYWFKSCPRVKPNEPRENCTRDFLDDYRTSIEENRHNILLKYIISGQGSDELRLFNVSDEDVGFYGCFVTNNRGDDIRLCHLKMERSQESLSIGTRISTNQLLTASNPSSIDRDVEQRIDNRNSLTQLPSTVSPERDNTLLYFVISLLFLIVLVGLIVLFIRSFRLPLMKDKKQNQSHQNLPSSIVTICGHEDQLRQHLPNGAYPDIYSARENSSTRFISGHHKQGNGPFMAQSISSHLLNKEKNPSISSNSDEASSWGKSMSSNGDNSRAFYLHTSNNTSTTVPMYDHPPSTGTMRGDVIQGCVINPTYGFLRLDSDASDWTFPRRNLERLNKIGEGQFGEVWRYIARQKDGNESYVAVKQLKNRAGLGDRERLELIAEIEIMKCVNNHPNVIKLLNYCADDYEPILLIMEFAENGKLQTYLRNCRSFRSSLNCLSESSPAITSKELVEFSYHIAKGMEYVASKGIIHRDLASRNILVSKDKICKVADFGFARRVSDDCAYERTTANPVPVKWMAPEALVENKFTSKSDVFSLGILMWEIVTLGATPYEYLTSSEVYRKVTKGERLQRPIHCKIEFYNIMERCWLHDPVQRPTFKELASQLERLLLSENDYIELDQYPEHAYYNILNTAEKEIVNIIEPIE